MHTAYTCGILSEKKYIQDKEHTHGSKETTILHSYLARLVYVSMMTNSKHVHKYICPLVSFHLLGV